MGGKHAKIPVKSLPIKKFPRVGLGYKDRDRIPTRSKSKGHSPPHRAIPFQRQVESESPPTAFGHPELRSLRRPPRQAAPPPAPNCREILAPRKPAGEQDYTSPLLDGPDLVVKTPKRRQPLHATSKVGGYIHRRLRLGTGSAHRLPPVPETRMVRTATNVAHQPQRALCHKMGHRVESTVVSEQIDYCFNGQYDCSGPNQERGRPSLQDTSPRNGQTLTSGILPPICFEANPPTGGIQHTGGQALSEPSAPRVAPDGRGNFSYLQEMGNARSGLICLPQIGRGPKLCHTRPVRSSSVLFTNAFSRPWVFNLAWIFPPSPHGPETPWSACGLVYGLRKI
uniref:Uncharacterized protein n=1 Tax=Cacopsylla melanoneura TaxID=428564 RepID=A0A8D8YWR9_9HEMI